MKKSSLNLEIEKQSRMFIMKILFCGIDVYYKESNFYFIAETTRAEFNPVVPTVKPAVFIND